MSDDGRAAASQAMAKQVVQRKMREQANQMKLAAAKRKLSSPGRAGLADVGKKVKNSGKPYEPL